MIDYKINRTAFIFGGAPRDLKAAKQIRIFSSYYKKTVVVDPASETYRNTFFGRFSPLPENVEFMNTFASRVGKCNHSDLYYICPDLDWQSIGDDIILNTGVFCKVNIVTHDMPVLNKITQKLSESKFQYILEEYVPGQIMTVKNIEVFKIEIESSYLYFAQFSSNKIFHIYFNS